MKMTRDRERMLKQCIREYKEAIEEMKGEIRILKEYMKKLLVNLKKN